MLNCIYLLNPKMKVYEEASCRIPADQQGIIGG
jgi:hypothetical protein